MKLRAPEGMSQIIFQRIGAAPVNIPGAEVYTALERGVVEAADWGTLGMNDDLGYHAIAPYPLIPGLPLGADGGRRGEHGALECAAGRRKDAGGMAVRDFNRDMVERIGMQDAAIAASAAANGVELVDWSREERRKFREVAAPVWAEYASGSPMAQRMYDSHIAFLRRLGLLEAGE